MKRTLLGLCALLVGFGALPASAEDWKFPVWNPFAKKEETSNLFPKFSPPPLQMAKPKNTLAKVNEQMTDNWNKFADFVNPFDDGPVITPRPGTPAATRKWPNLLPNWSDSTSSPPPSEKPNSVTDFLALPRPGQNR